MSQPDATPKQEKLRVLNLEDNPNDSELIQEQLGTEWPVLEFLRVDTREAFVRALDEFKPDVVLSDFKLPDMNGRDALNIVRQTHPDIPVIIVTGALGDEQAVELLGLGARDYILKDRLGRIAPALQRVLSEKQGISARKAAEKALHESEERLRIIFDGAHDGIALAEVETRRLVTVNPMFCRMLGYSREELSQLGVSDMHTQQDLPHAIEQFERLSRNEIQLAENIPLKRKDGSVLYVDIKGSLVNIGGKSYLMGVFRDITERKQTEAQIAEQLDELKRWYAAMTDREMRIMELKREVNELLAKAGQPPRYPSAEQL